MIPKQPLSPKRRIMNSSDLFTELMQKELIDFKKLPYWWPNYGKFEVILETILTQQSKFEKVQQSISYLKKFNFLSIDTILSAPQYQLASAIVPSGLYNQKASRIIALMQNIKNDFNDFETFSKEVTREWLLAQKGIGSESADAMLCYACKCEVMVIDNYTHKLLQSLDFTFESYEEMQNWIHEGIYPNLETLLIKFPFIKDAHHLFAIFHGLIVEVGKRRA